ncbi:MAG: ABC transporter permease subunit [Saprospiraceae bacterium]|nr:ABC transporter permease subunit [Saprospiraceae bacterium]MBK9727169.1 ABC transporter permease subunit [Saprospiraceae bacterium]
MLRLSQYIFYDIVRNKVILGYTAFLFLVSVLLFNLEENSSKAILSLLNIQLIVIPLISMIFSTIHYYNSYEFIELLLTQPISRTRVLLSEYLSTAFSLGAALLIGVGIPVLIYVPDIHGISLVLTGIGLTFVCTSIAFYASVISRDKARGIGIVLLLWFYFALIYDGIILMILFSFSDYPLETLSLILTAFNPIDLARVSIMLRMDVSALMGYTGALYKDFFGSILGMFFTFGILFLWMFIPLVFAVHAFCKKDL